MTSQHTRNPSVENRPFTQTGSPAKRVGLWLAGAALLTACGPGSGPPAAPPPEPPPPPTEHVPPPAPEEKKPLVKIIADAGLKTPESVFFDKDRDLYLISNINGAPTDKDNNGFISRVTPEGDLTLKFIEGGTAGAELHAPKGMTVSEGVLYVADIDRVRKFEAMTGKPLGDIELPGSTFVNGLSAGKDGKIYVSDTGLDAKFNPSGSDAVYLLQDDKPKKLISGKSLGGPNGLSAGEGGVWVTTFRSGELYWVSDDGEKEASSKMPKGKNDGLIATKDGRLLVSSWEGSSVFIMKPGEEPTVELSGVESPADIGYDCKRERIMVPLFTKDTIVFHDISPSKEEE